VFVLLGFFPILSAILGFLIFSNPNPERIAGESIAVVTNTPSGSETALSESESSPGWQPSPTPTKTLSEPEALPSRWPTPAPTITGILVYPSYTPIPLNQSSDLLQQINNFRTSKGLGSLTANDEVCFFAKTRANEITTGFNHDGFRSRIDNGSLPYSSWSEVAENIAVNPESGKVVEGWINSPGHNENLSKNVPYGCVAGVGHYYVFEAWAP